MPIVSPPPQEQFDMDQGNLTPPKMPAPEPKPASPSLLDVLSSAESEWNLAGQAYQRHIDPKPDVPEVPGFDPTQHIPKGEEENWTPYMDAKSPAEVDWIHRNELRAKSDQKISDDAGILGFTANVFAGITDPLTVLSMMAPESLIGGATRIERGLKMAALSGVTSFAQEGIAQSGLVFGRSFKDSAINVGASSIVGGLLGSIARSKVPLSIQDELAQNLHAELRSPNAPSKVLGPYEGKSSVGFSGPVMQTPEEKLEGSLDVKRKEEGAEAEIRNIEQEAENAWKEGKDQLIDATRQQADANATADQVNPKAEIRIEPKEGNSVVSTATGRQVEVTPKVMEADKLITSDMGEYPQELQPRQRDRAAMQAQVSEMARTLTPERLGASAEADRGSPIVGADNVVESGNGRVAALRDVYAGNKAKADQYREYLESLGHDTSKLVNPVLVRERATPMTDAERRAFTVEANQSSIAALSPVERAGADAMHLDNTLLDQLSDSDISSAGNANFVRRFIENLPMSERNEMLNADGTVGQAGVRRIQAAILSKAYGGNEASNATLGRLLESTDTDMRSTMGSLMDAAPRFARLRQAIADGKVSPSFDISKNLTQAVQELSKVRESGQNINEYLKQADMLSSRPPMVDDLMRAMYDPTGQRLASREKVTQRLQNYADQAARQRLDQMDLVGGQATPESLMKPTPEAAPMRPGADMFGLRTPQGKLPSPPLAISEDPAEQAFINPTGISAVGAQASSGPTLRGDTIARGARLYDKATGWVAPGSRLMNSPSVATRELTQELINIPMNLEKNYHNQITAQPVERDIWMTEGQHWQSMQARNEQYKAYVARKEKEGLQALSHNDFEEEISKAARRGDVSDIPEVAASAKAARAIVIKPWADRARKVGALAPEGDTDIYADSYLTRLYDRPKIRGDMTGWTNQLTYAFTKRDGMDSAEALDMAHSVTRNILGSERGTLDWNATQGLVPKSGRFKGRQLTLPDTYLEPYLNNNFNSIEHAYLRSIAPETLMTERFGDRNLTGRMADVHDDYARMIEAAPDNSAKESLLKSQGEDEKLLAAMRDRLYGIFGQPQDASSFGVRAGRMLRSVNAGRMLGTATFSHAPDLANVMLRYGMPNTFAGIGKLIASGPARDMAINEAKRMGNALDMTMNATASMLGDYVNHSDWLPQQIANRATRAFTIATGETPLITAMQSLSSVLGQDEMVRMAQKVAAGGSIDKNIAARMASEGIDTAMLGRIAAQHEQFGAKVGGLNFGMSDKWADQEAAHAFESAISREAHAVTLRPGAGDTPLFMSKEWGKTVMQFKSFGFSANRSVTAPLLQGLAHGDPRAAQALLALVSMGALSYYIKQKISGQPVEPWDSPKFAAEVLDKSNLLGWTGEVLFPAAAQLGYKNMSRFSDRDPVETLGGPTAGTIADAFTRQLPGRVAQSALPNEMLEKLGIEPSEKEGIRRSDLHFLRKLMPGQNLWYLRRGINDVEDAIGDQFDLPGTSNADRAAQNAGAQ